MYHGTSTPPGFKIRLGDLHENTTAGQIDTQIWMATRTPGDEVAYDQIPELNGVVVKQGGADSGAAYATITVSGQEAATRLHTSLWGWQMGRQLEAQPAQPGFPRGHGAFTLK